MNSTHSKSLPGRASRSRRRARRNARLSKLRQEALENRILLAGDTAAWHNADLPLDTNEDGRVTALDALVAINDLNANGIRDVDVTQTPNGMVDVDANGVISPSDPLRIINHLNSGAGESHHKVRFRLAATGLQSEDPLTSLNPNEDFLLRVYVSDLTDAPGGVFAAYLDVNYTQQLADVVGAVEFSDDWPNDQKADTSVDGLIDESGAFFGAFQGTGAEESLVYSIPMRTENAAGTLTFTGDPADNLPAHEVLLFSENDPVLGEEIEFVGTSVQINAEQTVTAVNDSYAAVEDETLEIDAASGVLANDINPDGVDLTAIVISEPTNGTVKLNANGSFSYEPNENYFGADSFTYVANNGIINSNAATVTLSVAAVNDPPVAVGESYSVPGSTADAPSVLQVIDPAEGLLANDSDVEESVLTVEVTVTTPNGELNVTPQGLFTYVPNVGFAGTDSFTYVVNDGELSSEPAVATIEVLPVDGPTAHPDTYLAVRDNTVEVETSSGVLVNDTDPNGDPLTAQLVNAPSNGTVTLDADGALTYTPNAGFLGTDSFTYVASDGTTSSEPATVSIIVQANGGGDAPVVDSDEYETLEDTILNVEAPGILANDFDADGDNFIANLLLPPQNGTLTLNPDGSFEYIPNEGFTGQDRFGYTASDGLLRSNAGAVTIVVIEVVDNPPIANDESYDVEFETPLVVSAENGILANDSDPDGDTITASLFASDPQLPANGTLALEADGSFVYTPNDGFHGVDSFQYLVQSGDLTSTRVATTTLNVAEPIEDGPLVVFRLEATDGDGQVITSIDSGDTFNLNVYVQDTSPEPREGVFSAYLDVLWDSALAAVDGTINYSDVYLNGRTGDTSSAGLIDEVGAFDGDQPLGPDERLLFSVPLVTAGQGELTLSADPADVLPFGDVLLYDTLTDAVPQEQIDYGSVTLTILGLTEPVAVDDAYTSALGSLSVGVDEGVLVNDISIGVEGLQAELIEGPSNGTVELNADGSFTYTANSGFLGQDTFTYRAVEGEVVSNPATVSIRVGDLTPVEVAGSIYWDTNNNGTREAHELPFGGVEVLLTGTTIEGESVSLSQFTDRDGNYSFDDVITGVYELTEVQPEIVVDGIDSHDGVVAPENDSFQITLQPDGELDGYNFGERGLHPAFFGNPFFFASRKPEGFSVGLRPDGTQAWYSFDSGWDDYQSVRVSLAADRLSVTITAISSAGIPFTTTHPVGARAGVLVTGNPSIGHYIKLSGPSSDYGLQPAINAAAADAVFGG